MAQPQKQADASGNQTSTNITTLDNTPSTNNFDWYLSIISYLKANIPPAKIAAKLGVPKTTLQYHLNKLKKQGVIRKIGYGTWEILKPLEFDRFRSTNSSHVGTPQHPPQTKQVRKVSQADLTRFTQDAVRAHAFLTTWSVQRGMHNWNNHYRIKYLISKDIPFKPLNIGGGGQRIIVKDRKTWLTDKSIIIYDKSSYFAEEALQAKNTALATHLSIIKHIERLLHTSFQIGTDYKFKVSRQHYALIYNALAKQYNSTGEKLEVRTGKGLWLLIDDSYSMNELETVHPSTGMTDNKKTQDFFNGLKAIPAVQGAPSYTPGVVLEMIHDVAANQVMFAQNIKSHITAIQDLGTGVRDLNGMLEQLKEAK